MEKEIGRIPKNETTDIVVRIDDFGGKRGLTIREFITTERYTGFTKSGVRISPENFSKFKEMINSVSEEVLSEPAEDAESAEDSAGSQEQKKINDSSKDSEENSEEVKVEKVGELPDY